MWENNRGAWNSYIGLHWAFWGIIPQGTLVMSMGIRWCWGLQYVQQVMKCQKCKTVWNCSCGSGWVGMQNWRLPSKLVVVVLTEDLPSLKVILYAFITLVKIMQFQIVTDSKIWSNIPRTLYTMFIWKARVIRWVSVGQCTHSRIWTPCKCAHLQCNCNVQI